MSKQTRKTAATKRKTATRSKMARPRAGARAEAPTNRTAAATIFVYQVNGQARVRTSPQILPAGPGFIEWTVVNLASDDPVDVDITWDGPGPWGDHKPIKVKNGNHRMPMTGAKNGNYKYHVTVNGYTEDPEIEIPWN